MAIKEHSLLFIHTQTPRKRNNPFHSSVLCTHPGGRFLPDLSRRGYLSTKSSRANFSGGTKRGAGGGIFVLVSSSSSLAQASDCLCRMISYVDVLSPFSGDDVCSFIVLPCKAMRRSSSHHGADSDYSDSLALRRWRRLISPRMAVTMNCASVSFSSLTKFISLKTSRGTLAVFCCDLLLVVPVGITGLLTVRWRSVYAEKKIKKGLKCKSPESSIAFKGDLHQKATPRSGGTHTGRLTTNDSNSIEVAMRNHTTHPQGRDSHNLNKYIWRFIAFGASERQIIHVTAWTEREARNRCPSGCVAVFAARIRQGETYAQ